MSVVKIASRVGGFTIMQKDCMEDTALSWNAKGLFAYLMGQYEDWEIRIDVLIGKSNQGKCVVYRSLNELIEAGYMKRVTARDEGGRHKETIYHVYETRQLAEVSIVVNNQAVKEKSLLSKKWKAVHNIVQLSKNQDAVKQDPVNQPYNNNKNRTKNKETIRPGADAVPVDNSLPLASPASFLKTEMTEQQSSLVVKRIRAARLPKHFTERQWLVGLARELDDQNSFNQCHNFLHKLNTILKLAKQGRWSPNAVLANSSARGSDVLSEKQKACAKLHNELSTLQQDKFMWERVIQTPKRHENSQEYIASARKMLAKKSTHIAEVHNKINNLTEKEEITSAHSN